MLCAFTGAMNAAVPAIDPQGEPDGLRLTERTPETTDGKTGGGSAPDQPPDRVRSEGGDRNRRSKAKNDAEEPAEPEEQRKSHRWILTLPHCRHDRLRHPSRGGVDPQPRQDRVPQKLCNDLPIEPVRVPPGLREVRSPELA